MTIESTNRHLKRRLSDPHSEDPPTYTEVVSPLPHSPETFKKDGDNDLMSAAEVLTQLTRSESTPPHDFSEHASTIASPMLSTSLHDLEQQQHPIVLLVTAVTKLPIVTNAVRYYESSKRNYATFNYAAEMVEKAAMPVFSKIEVNLNSMHQARLEEARLKKKRRLADKPKDKNEIKKRIKFCLHILKLANDNISSKVVDLQQKIKDKEAESLEKKREHQVKLEQAEAESESSQPVADATPKEAQETKTEIVATVKKIIHVISNFKPSSLDVLDKTAEEAQEKEADDVQLKSTIREIIFDLPNQIQQSAVASAEPQQGNDKIVLFAKESLDMITRLTTVFNEQLEKAEKWVGGEEKGPEKAVEQFHSPLNSSDESIDTHHA